MGDGFRQAEAVCSATQWLPAALMRQRQWTWVQAILDAAYHASPLYRRRLESAGWPDITPRTFCRIPPLTRNDIERHVLQIPRPVGRTLTQRSSGGTSGPRITIPLDWQTHGWYVAGTWRGLGWWGVEPPHPLVLLLGRAPRALLPNLLTWTKDSVMNWRRLPIDHRFDRKVPEILNQIEAFGPACLYGYPSAVHQLARAIRIRGWNPRRRLRVTVLTGEPLYAFQRRAIQGAFQCPVVEEYGAGELGCIAFECPHGTLHIAAESVYVETLRDSTTGGETAGRVLVTHLRNRVFPLIRYDTGDIGVTLPDSCRCGRGLPALLVLGRAHDGATGAGDSAPARERLEQLFHMLPEHLHGSVRVVHSAAASIVLQVERRAIGSSGDVAHLSTIGTNVFGAEWDVRATAVEQFSRLPSGKLPYLLRRQR